MPRKPKPAAQRLLEGRSPGRDSGGRKVPIPPRPVFTPPSMPPGLPTPVRREWRRVVAELEERDLPMPPPEVLAGHCRTLVRQHETAAALEHEPAGTTTWRRLITTEGELGTRIAAFYAEYFAEAPAPVFGDYTAVEHNPFDGDGRRRKTPSLIKMKGSRPMPKTVVENPCPPRDARYHEAWVAAIRESDRNHAITRPPGFYTREFHYNGAGELWDDFWPADDQ